jgi:hypothetical protein
MFNQNIRNMLKDIIEALRHVSSTHKGVYTFRYQGDDLNNAQNNYKGYQVYVDDISLHQLNITTGIFKVEFQVYVLGHPTSESGNTILDVQNNAYTIAVDIMGKIDTDEAYRGILSVYDYSILTLSHYTDDNAAGVKLSLVLQMPSPLNYCELDDNFDDEEHEEEQDHEIDVPTENIGDIDITPIKLPKNRDC